MAKKAIAPTPKQPINRLHLGQLPNTLTVAQCSSGEDHSTTILASEFGLRSEALASYDGDEE